MALRISQKEKKLIQSRNQSARRKNKRLQETFGLPSKFTVRPLSSFTTRKELNQYKENLRRFLLPSTERYYKGGTYLDYRKNKVFNYSIPASEYNEIQRILRRRNAAIKRQQERFKKVRATAGNESLNVSLNEFLAPRKYQATKNIGQRYAQYFPIKIQKENITSRRTLNRFKYSINKFQSVESLAQKRNIAHENYSKALYNTFGAAATALIDIIDEMTDEQFIEFFESDEFAQFGYIYDPTVAQEILQIITEHALTYVREQNLDLPEEVLYEADYVSLIDSSIIITEYNRGIHGGRRIMIENKRQYIDLTPEEVIEYDNGKPLTQMVNYPLRVKQYQGNPFAGALRLPK